jgi:hypothetical protein
MRLIHSLVVIAAIHGAGCNSSKAPPPSHSATPTDAGQTPPGADSAPPPISRDAMVDEVTRLLRAGDTKAALQMLSADENARSGDPVRAWYAVYFSAAAHAYEGDLDAGLKLLDQYVAASRPHGHDGLQMACRSARAWLKWSMGDLDGALADINAIEPIVATWPDNDKKTAMLHVYWDRAYLTLDMAARQGDRRKRKELVIQATALRKQYEVAAVPKDEHLIGHAAIGAHFALQAGKVAEAVKLSKDIDESKADSQDLFIAARAAIAGKDLAQAKALRAKIAETPDLMTAVVLRELDKELATVR